MNQEPESRRKKRGSALLVALVFTVIVAGATVGLLQLSSHRLRLQYDRWDWHEAYFHAENGLNWMSQQVANAPEGGASAAFLGNYHGPTDPDDPNLKYAAMPYVASLDSAGLGETWITVENHPSGIEDLYLITASARVGDKVRTVQADVMKDPPSRVFDYEYFLNNWGWWWGSTITGYGDNRSNWDFDFRYDPVVNGHVLAGGSIEENQNPVDPFSGNAPFNGLAGDDPLTYVHSGVPRLTMPNLKDLTDYQALAQDSGGTIKQGATTLVNAVHTDASKPGFYMVGTDASPIVFDGPTVIPGDVIIKGKITGQGTLYVGGNLYIAGNLEYKNPPNFATAPMMLDQDGRDAWVETALDGNKDLISFAVKESILAGQVNSSAWKSACYNPSGYGLKYVGDERTLGADGIDNTPDDTIPYLDTNADGTPDSTWYDADADGAQDLAYNYDTQLTMTSTRSGKIMNYPTSSGTRVNYDTISTNSMNKVDGILYTNHAAAMRLATANTIMRGALICRDEAIIFSSTLKFLYDPRIHSRYSNDPNRYIDLGLPIAEKVRLEGFSEIAPLAGYHNS